MQHSNTTHTPYTYSTVAQENTKLLKTVIIKKRNNKN